MIQFHIQLFLTIESPTFLPSPHTKLAIFFQLFFPAIYPPRRRFLMSLSIVDMSDRERKGERERERQTQRMGFNAEGAR